MINRQVFYFLLTVFVVTIFQANGQKRIKGIVVSEKGNPLPYSSISLMGQAIGVIANAEGKFSFIIPNRYTQDTLVVSMLGFETLLIPIDGLVSQNLQFSLKEKVFELDEIIIFTRQLSGEEILKEAIKRQKENRPKESYALDLFIRELFYHNDSCNAVVESAAQLFGKKYPKHGFDIYLDQTRYALGKQRKLPTGLSDYNPFREFRGIVGGSLKVMKPCKECQYEVEEYVYADDQKAAMISLVHKPGREYPIFRYLVGLENYAILRFEFETNIPFGEAFVTHHGVITSSLISLKRTIEYQLYKGRYYLKSYRQWSNHGYRNADNSITYQTPHSFLVLANSVQNKNIESLKATKINSPLMNYQSTLMGQSKNNDPAFWENYNAVKRTSEEDRFYHILSEK